MLGLFVCVFDLATFFLFYHRVVRELTLEETAAGAAGHDGGPPVGTRKTGAANLAFALSILGVLIPVGFLWFHAPGRFVPGHLEQSLIRGMIVAGTTLSVLVAAIALGWSTRRLMRGRAALIAASLSLLIAGSFIVKGLQQNIPFFSGDQAPGESVPDQENKLQRFVPQPGLDLSSNWSVLPKGSDFDPEGWGIIANLATDSPARISHPGRESPFMVMTLLGGDTGKIRLKILDLSNKSEVIFTLPLDESNTISVGGKGYTVRFPTVDVGPDGKETTPLAPVLVFEGEGP